MQQKNFTAEQNKSWQLKLPLNYDRLGQRKVTVILTYQLTKFIKNSSRVDKTFSEEVEHKITGTVPPKLYESTANHSKDWQNV